MKLDNRDLRKLAPSFLLSLVLIGAGAAGVWWTLDEQKLVQRNHASSQSRFSEADRRLREVSNEEAEIRDKSTRFRMLSERQIIGAEQRLEWVEAIGDIRRERRLFEIDYEFSPQRSLSGNGAYRFNGSEMKFRLPLLHEGDLLNFLKDLQDRAPALIQAQHCTLDRAAGLSRSNLSPQLSASCTLQWITIGDGRRETTQ